jgi:threonine synthase
MDIQVSSNFERLLFEAERRDSLSVTRAMGGLAQSGAFSLGDGARASISPLFASGFADEEETAATIARVLRDNDMVVDPHTAVALCVAERQPKGSGPMITLATAHPAKFPDAVRAACGVVAELPDWARGIMGREEHYEVRAADLSVIEAAIEARSRAARVPG